MTTVDERPAYADLWEATLGTEWKMTDGVSTLINMKAIARNKQPRWRLVDPAHLEYWSPPHHVQDLHHVTARKPDARGDVHRWDMRSAYLAAAGMVNLPYRQLTPYRIWDHTADVGYYRVRITRDQAAQMFLPRPDRTGCVWVTHPMLDIVRRASHEIVEAWTSDDHGRILRPWSEGWRDAIIRCPLLRPALKLGYAQAVGLMGSRTKGIYRPDWRHIIIGHVRASVTRRIIAVQVATGLRPYKVDVDSVYYDVLPIGAGRTVGTIDQALGVGPNIGNMRYEGIVTL
jgi:hypothetical protein